MSKVIVERPRLRIPKRAGSHYPRGHLKALFETDLDQAPQKLGMRVPHQTKWLNENLAPLRRWLRGQVGRPWSKVRGELRAVVDARSATQLHILQHVDDFVAEHVAMIDGVPHRHRWSGLAPIVGYAGLPVWVCPRSGILRAPPREARAAERFGAAIRLRAELELRRVEGVWRAVDLERLPADDASRAACFDVLLGEPLCQAWFAEHRPRFKRLFGRDDAYAVAIRAPGLRERKHIRGAARA